MHHKSWARSARTGCSFSHENPLRHRQLADDVILEQVQRLRAVVDAAERDARISPRVLQQHVHPPRMLQNEHKITHYNTVLETMLNSLETYFQQNLGHF